MDNFTHSLIGLVAGEAVARATRTGAGGLSADTRRNVLVVLGVVGGNLPDLDLVLSFPGLAHDKLGYLLEHRGYTHTVLGCAVLALLLYAGALLWTRLKHLTLSRPDQVTLGCMAVLGVFLHLGMDSLNSYGVHPFWPADNEWFYGDSVFIVEPMYWLAAAPLFFLLRTVWARVTLSIGVLVALIASVAMHLSQPAWAAGIIAITVVLIFIGARATPRVTSYVSVVTMLLVTAGFVAASHAASARVDAIAAQSFPGYTTVDRVLTPTPMNPSCWDVLLIQTGGNQYIVRHGVLSTASKPAASQCPRVLEGGATTAPMTKLAAAESAEMYWLGEFSMPVERLAAFVSDSCDARELMQFARAPFAVEVDARRIMGDLRFDREAGLGMSEIELNPASGRECRHNVPWVPPRAGLLDQRK